jgi:hypothetical protein
MPIGEGGSLWPKVTGSPARGPDVREAINRLFRKRNGAIHADGFGYARHAPAGVK